MMEILKKILGWLITLLVPLVLVLIGVRILISPIFIQVEYRMPGFPADTYGFTNQERLYWADISRKYLTNWEGIEYLAELRFPEGEQAAGDCRDYLSPRDCGYFYNDRELKHMLDVKIVARYAMWFMWGSIIVLLGLGFWAKKSDWWEEYKWALSRGGWITVGLIVALMVYLILNFNQLFVNFHQIFFADGTWMFRFSDSLIRLFPVQFWRDAFIWVGVIALGGGIALGYFGSRRGRK
jgi:integral membrane protein (TIGR01906 family)